MSRFDWKKALKEGDPAIERIEDDSTLTDTIEMINETLNVLYGVPQNDLTEISIQADKVVEYLSDLWNDSKDNSVSYATFVRFIALIDRNILDVTSRIFDSFDMSNIKKGNVKQILSYIQAYRSGISQICNPNTPQTRPWRAEPYTSKLMLALESLTKKFIDILRIISDISSLLDYDEQESLHFSSIIRSASDIIPTTLIANPARMWEARFRLFEARLSQAEKVAASKLHTQLISASSSPEVVLYAFKAHPQLLLRPAAVQELGHEFSEAASFISTQIQRTMQAIPKKRNDSPVTNIVWFQQKKITIENYMKFTRALPDPIELQEQLNMVVTNLKEFGREQMKRWVEGIQSRIFSALKVPDENTLVEFGEKTGGLVVVNFSSELCQFLEEVRIIEAAKMALPKKVMELAKRAQPFYDQALILQRVAMFYNNMTERIIKPQLPMLLQPAADFEALVKATKDLKSENAKQLLTGLQFSLSNIMDHNTKLKQEHKNVIGKIEKLLDVDLVDQRQTWVSTMSEIRQAVNAVTKVYPNAELWMNHLDTQIYKALQYQFRASLLGLSERTAQIEVNMIFTNNKIQYRPSIEEIRRVYYQSVNDLLLYPQKFRGISQDSFFFAPISKSAPEILLFVYQKGELLIRKVFDYQFQFKEWSILAENLKDLEQKSSEQITTASEWKSNISLVSMRKMNINKIDDTTTIGCFKIDTTQAKEGFRRLLSQFQTILIIALRKTLAQEFDNVKKFVSGGLEIMTTKFETSEQIAESRRKFEDLVRSKVEVELTFTSLTEKVNLLKSFESIEQETQEFENLHKDWKRLTSLMETFDDTIASQFENVKNKMKNDFAQLCDDVHKFREKWDVSKPRDDLNFDSDDVVVSVPQIIAKFKTECDELRVKYESLAKPLSDFDENVQLQELDDVQEEIKQNEEAMDLLVEWRNKYTEITSQKWEVASQKLFLVEDFLNGWSTKLSSSESTSTVALYIHEKVSHYKSVYPFLKYVRGDDWCDEHWFSFFKMVGLSTNISYKELQLGDLLDVGDMLQANIKAIKELAERARGEATIRSSLEEVRSWFSTTTFAWFNHTFAGRTTYIVREWKQLLSDLADKQSLIGSLKDSPFIKAFQNDVVLWDAKAISLSTSLRLLNEIQRKWLHLEPVFVKKALPAHQDEFEKVDAEFRNIMNQLRESHRAASAADLSAEQLEKILHRLDQLNRALNVFLEQKRDKFSRFYFIGDEDLLEIIGQASEDATIIQAHLKKLFQGVHSVKFDTINKTIVSICSSMGETVDLKKTIKCEGPVEEWLMQLSNQVAETLRLILCDMMNKSNVDYYTFPSQLTLLYHQIKFTELVEKEIKTKGNGESISKYVEENLHALVAADQNDELQRYVVRSLIIEYVRFRQVAEDFASNPTSKWQWQKQLRFYFRDSNAFAEMGDAIIPYGFEYQGNPARLVYTPLTAKCYLTLCEGIALGYGGNPYGPAGTGKTESVKALGQALGRQVLVFNCDEAIDVQSMCRIFTGLVMGGAWGCFDEFNRLDEEVLSALSQQIQVIQTAILEHTSNVELMGRNINVNPNAGIYVTLNPAGKGYGGRSKLPSNLTQLFRAVAMSAPDNELIAEVLMYSQGFHLASKISKQLVLVFSLCRQLLSPERHYDWGLRALKSVLSTAEQWLNHSEGTVDESALVVKAMRISTLSKLTFPDRVQFEQIITDVFPNVNIETVEQFELRTAASEVLKERKLVELPHQIEKMLQMWEAVNQRMGVCIVGPSGCGKTTLWTLLQSSLDKIGIKINMEIMNPKSMPRQRLLGRVDYDTREWFDGVLTRAARRAVASSDRTWIICDGDIDPEWIESLNSVLDDNRLLTLPNGERIQFDNSVNFVFESHSLEHASPATVSRMAVILLSLEDLNVQNVCQSWIDKWPKDSRVGFLMEQLFYRTIDSIVARKNLFMIQSTTFGVMQTVLSHLDLISGNSDTEFVNALIRGSVAILPPSEQLIFANEIFKWASQLGLPIAGIDPQNILDQYWNGSSLQLFDFHPMPATKPSLDVITLPLVATAEVQRTIHTIKPWIERGEPVLLIGPRGSGKTCVLTHLFKMLTSTTIIVLNCSAKTDANSLLSKLLQQCSITSTATGQVLRPRNTEKALVFFKNFDLPRPDKYGTVQLISFMQQVLTHGGFYNEELQWINIERIQFVFSMSSNEKRPISPRFTSIIRISSIHDTQQDQLIQIYSHYLSVILKETPFKDSSKVSAIASAMIRVFNKIKNDFSIDEYPHYDFTFRDITRWVVNLQRYIHNSNTFTPNIVIYEGCRVFLDRISGLNDRARMLKEIKQIFKELMPPFEETDFDFTNYQIESNDKTPLYLVQTDKPIAQDAFRKLVVSYEREMGHLDICRMQDTEFISHRIMSILAVPCSNIVAITTPGLSFVEILRVVCHSTGVEICSPPPLADFSYSTFTAFLKELISKISQKDEEVVMLIEDFMFVDDAILDALNSLMASGEVGGLFSQAEFDSLIASVQAELREADSDLTPQEFFCAKVKRLIHTIVVLNPDHSSFKSYFSFAPSFISNANLIWATELSRESLSSIPHQVLTTNSNDDSLSTETITKITPKFVALFGSVDEPPIRYSHFLELYRSIFTIKHSELSEKKKHLDIGLSKLNDAAKTVDTLSGEINAKKENLSVKERAAQEAMERIKKAVTECSQQQAKIETMSKQLSVEESKLQIEQSKIEEELGSIQPEIDAALALVGQIRRDQLAEVRAFPKPPPAVADVMQGVLLMLGEDDSSWPAIKKTLGSDGFVNRIMRFDANALTQDIINKVEKLLKTKGQSFEAEIIKKASQAVAPLAQWVKANIRFFSVLEKVDPLRKQNEKYAKEIQKKRVSLQDLRDKKKAVDAKVEEYQEQFRKSTKEAELLKNEVKTAEANLHDAEQLFSKLKDERTRWDNQRAEITTHLNKLPKEALLAAAVASFCGKYPEDERKKMLQTWNPIVGTTDDTVFSLSKFMYTESKLLELRGCLGGDSLSIENAVIITNTNIVPLIIDPTSIALNWLVQYYEKEGKQATVLPRAHERFSSELALAVRFGKTLIITEIDSIDGILLPLIRCDLVYSGARPAIKVGDREIDYNENFRLILVTREPSPQLHPTAAAHISTVNFSVTRSGLESILLSLTLEKEDPSIQIRRSECIADQEKTKKNLSDLEVSLLQALVAADGADILHNTELIETLNKTKEQATAAAKSLAEAENIYKSIEETANTYKGLAALGASLYFAIASLYKLDHMYRYSSNLFLQLFSTIFQAKPAGSSSDSKAMTMKYESNLAKVIFQSVTTSMFNKHRAAAALHIIKNCFPNIINEKQYEMLLNEPVGNSDAPRWVPEDRKQSFSAFAQQFPDIVQSLKMKDLKFENTWSEWISQPVCEKNWPQIENQTMEKRGVGQFTQLLIISVLAPHRLVPTIENYITNNLQLKQFSTPFDLNQVITDKSGLPIIFIVSAGADPSKEIKEMCRKNRQTLTEIAVGQGSIDQTIQALRKCAEEGTMLLLKNTHLSMTLVSRVEKEYASLTNKKDGFKLMMTTEPHRSFPPLLLANSIKVALEAPPGVRANLIRTLSAIDPKGLTQPQLRNIAAVAYFHSIIQERRIFNPQGWTKFYEFSSADFSCALQIIERSSEGDSKQFEYIRGLLGIAVYGGRVDNDFDFKVLTYYLEKFVSDSSNPLKLERNSNFQSILNNVKAMDERDPPSVFFLPPNATKTVALSRMTETISCLRRLVAISSEGGAIHRAQWCERLNPLAERWKEIIRKSPKMIEIRQTSPADDSPMAAALYSQYCIVHELVTTLSLFFKELEGFLHKGDALSHKLQQLGTYLIAGEVPDEWFDVAEGPVVASEWLVEVARKVDIIDALAMDPALVSKGIELGSLLRPTAILDALRQQTAKETKIPIVELQLVFGIGEEHEHAIYVKDIALQGAVLQGNKIAQMQRDDSITLKCPTCSFSWEKEAPAKTTPIPLYSNTTRSRFIVSVPTSYHGDSMSFVFAGSAFILNR